MHRIFIGQFLSARGTVAAIDVTTGIVIVQVTTNCSHKHLIVETVAPGELPRAAGIMFDIVETPEVPYDHSVDKVHVDAALRNFEGQAFCR